MNMKRVGLLLALAGAWAATAAVTYTDWTADGEINWKTAADGDFNAGANWEGGVVPGPKTNAVIEKTGADYTVTLDATPAFMKTNVIAIGNSGANTTTVEIVGSDKNVTLDETFLYIKPNGVFRVADGAKLKINALTCNGNSGVTTLRYLFNGVNRGDNGRFEIDNASVDIDFQHSYWLGYNQRTEVVLTNGATLTFHDRNAVKENRYLSGWTDSKIVVTDTSRIVVDNPLEAGGNLTFGDLELSGDAVIAATNKCWAFSSANCWPMGSAKRIRSSHVVIKDNAHLTNLKSNNDTTQSFYLCDSGADGASDGAPSSLVFDWYSSWRGMALKRVTGCGLIAYGFFVGSGQSGCGHDVTLNMGNGASVLNKGNGVNIGCSPDSAGYRRSQTKVKGVVNIRNGFIYNGGTGIYPEFVYALAVGSSEWAKLSTNPSAYGQLNIYDGGAFTNKTYSYGEPGNQSGSYIHVGASRGEGEINQYGGDFHHEYRMQAIIGVRGGTGRYNMSGGRAYFMSEVYVGGIPYERMQTVIEGMDHFSKADFALKYDYLNKGATGTVYVTGGKFETATNLCVSAFGKGTVRMGGDSSALLLAKNISLESTADGDNTYTSDVIFDVGANGTGVLQAQNRLVIGAGAELTVNVTETPDRGWTKLIEYGEVEGEFAKITVNGPGEVVRKTRKGANAYWLKVPHGCAVMVK